MMPEAHAAADSNAVVAQMQRLYCRLPRCRYAAMLFDADTLMPAAPPRCRQPRFHVITPDDTLIAD